MTVPQVMAAPGRPIAGEDARRATPEGRPTRSATSARSVLIWLVLIVAVSSTVRTVVGLRSPGPWILPDELLYAELARSIADGGLPSVRGASSTGWGVVYPLVIAPVWALFDDPIAAYRGTLAVNALLMSTAAVPAYLLARVHVRTRSALVVAALSVAVPSMSSTGVVMTENAWYPVFLLALWLIARVVRNPSVARQAVALTSIGLATVTRVQGILLLVVLVAAVALWSRLLEDDYRGRYLRRLWPTLAAAVIVLVGSVAAAVLSGGAPTLLGGRSGTFDELRVTDLPRLFAYQMADVVLLVAVVPALATATVILTGLRRGASAEERVFASICLPTIAVTLAVVAAVGSSIEIEGVVGLNERYVFHLSPLLFLGLAIWFEGRRAMRTVRIVGTGVIVVAGVMVAILPFDRLSNDASFYAPGLSPWVALGAPRVLTALIATVFVALLGALWLRARTTSALGAWSVVGAYVCALALVALASHGQHAARAAIAFDGKRPTWVDDAVPKGTQVDVLLDRRRASTTRPDRAYFRLMLTEFFNPSIGATHLLGSANDYENVLPTAPVSVDAAGRIIDALGQPLDADYVVVPCALGIRGSGSHPLPTDDSCSSRRRVVS